MMPSPLIIVTNDGSLHTLLVLIHQVELTDGSITLIISVKSHGKSDGEMIRAEPTTGF